MSPHRTLSVLRPFPLNLLFRSAWADAPIDLEAPLASEGWEGAGELSFERGHLLAKNDARFLYLALDVVEDTGNDPGTGDYFWLTFDVNRDRSITANRDVNFAVYPNDPARLGKQFYLGPNQWTGLRATEASVRAEFGPSSRSDRSHRIWKFRIPLSEISVNLAWPLGTPHTFLGFRVNSARPRFQTEVPPGFGGDFSQLRQLILSRRPSIPLAQLGPVMGTVGLIPTTAIASSGRATTDASYFVPVQNAAFGGTLNVLANRSRLQALWSAGARKYRVQIRAPGSSAWSDLVSTWSNYRWNASAGEYVLHSFAPTVAGVYTLPNPAHEYSIPDLLVQFPTTSFPAGLHQFRMLFFRNDATTPVPAPSQILRLFIDNHLPRVVIESIQHRGREVEACAIQEIGAAPDGVRLRITAHDAEGNLRRISLRATYGDNQSTQLFAESYEPSMGNWQGFENRWIPASGGWRPPMSCAYSFVLRADARTTNGYQHIGWNQVHRNLTLLV